MARHNWKSSKSWHKYNSGYNSRWNRDTVVHLKIPNHQVGRIKGHRGNTLYSLEKRTGAYLKLRSHNSELPLEQRHATLIISGTPSSCKRAQQLVTKMIDDWNYQEEIDQNANNHADETHIATTTEVKSRTSNFKDCPPDSCGKNAVSTDVPSLPVSATEDKPKDTLQENEICMSLTKPPCKFCLGGKCVFKDIIELLQNFFCKRQFKCKTCDRIFSTENRFSSHLKSNTGKECDKTCISYCLNLQKQINMKDKFNDKKNCSNMTFTCEFCPKSYDLEISVLECNAEQEQNVLSHSVLNFSNSNNSTSTEIDPMCFLPLVNNQTYPYETCQISAVKNEYHLQQPPEGSSAHSERNSSETASSTTPVTASGTTPSKQKFACEICNVSFRNFKQLSKHSVTVHQSDKTQKSHKEETPRNNCFQGNVNSRNTSELSTSLEKKKLSESSSCKKISNRKKGPSKTASNVRQNDMTKCQNTTSLDSAECAESSVSDDYNVRRIVECIISIGERGLGEKPLSDSGLGGSQCNADTSVAQGHHELNSHQNTGSHENDVAEKEIIEIDLTKVEEETASKVKSNARFGAKLNSSTKQRESPLYPCKTCPANFKLFEDLRVHRLQHFMERVTCGKCCRTFDRKSDMDEHFCFHPKRRRAAEDWWSK